MVRPVRFVAVICTAVALFPLLTCTYTSAPATLNGHQVVLDRDGKLLSWAAPQAGAYGQVVTLAWQELERMRAAGKPYLRYSQFDPVTLHGAGGPDNPAGLFAMLTQSGLGYFAYSGDAQALTLVREAIDQALDHGTTPAGWDWPSVPFASSNAGDAEFRGADDSKICGGCGAGDGTGVIEPDKVGELGFAYLRLYEATADRRYLAAAVAAADALAGHVRAGSKAISPWPFRVHAETGRVRDEYSADVVGPLSLLDELIRLGSGNVEGYRRARQTAWSWLLAYPMRDNIWSGYFEDITSFPDPAHNLDQYIPLQTAQYLLAHPELDPDWRTQVPALIGWTKQVFGADTASGSGRQWGATAISEQTVYMEKMGSHTARYAAASALWSQAGGDSAAGEEAYRSFNWASYMCDSGGIVSVAAGSPREFWFSDGYGDYIDHFLAGMGALPEWAPPHESHLLQSSSVITEIDYGSGRVAYRTFDRGSTEELRLTFKPILVSADGRALPLRSDLAGAGYTVDALPGGDWLLRVRHQDAPSVAITG
jgi:hypothetical protein